MRTAQGGLWTRRLALAVGSVVIVLALVSLGAGVTYARMSATVAGQTNAFTAGIVTVGLDTSGTQVNCTITGMNLGGSSAGAPIDNKQYATCKYQVKYTGSVNAWLAVDVSVSNGGTALFTSGSTQGLQLYLADGSTGSTTPYGGTAYLTSGATDSGGTGGTTYPAQHTGTATNLPVSGISDLLVSATAATPGTIKHFSLDYALPADTATSFQGGSVTVTLTFHAVQAANNVIPTGANSCSTGQRCNTAMSWS